MPLMIIADDYGMHPNYDRGILEAAQEQLVDGVSVMVERDADPDPLIFTGVDIGLHLELGSDTAGEDLHNQLGAFRLLFGRDPAYLDSHKHSHALEGVRDLVIEEALLLEVPVRSVNTDHRDLLRLRGVKTADRTVGRMSEEADVVPQEVRDLQDGITEWFTHPGYPGGPSSYDAGREEDLQVLREFQSWPRITPSMISRPT